MFEVVGNREEGRLVDVEGEELVGWCVVFVCEVGPGRWLEEVVGWYSYL